MEKKGSANNKGERDGKTQISRKEERSGKKMSNGAQRIGALIKKEKDSFLEENRKLVHVEDDHLEQR
jgi:hypothetical protein